jgi:hypothetical protein
MHLLTSSLTIFGLFSLSFACLVMDVTLDLFANMKGTITDNNVQVCKINAPFRYGDNPPNWFECIDGVHAFISSLDVRILAYAAHGDNFRVPVNIEPAADGNGGHFTARAFC